MEERRLETSHQIIAAIHRDRRGMLIKTHGITGYYRKCRCEVCVGEHQKQIDAGTYDSEPSRELLLLRAREVAQLHAERLRVAYQAYCDRVPRGFKPIHPHLWALTQGAQGTIFPPARILEDAKPR